MAMNVEESRIPAQGVLSLVWDGDELVDMARGGWRYPLDGDPVPNPISHGNLFDAAVALPDSPWSVIYTRRGTKGLVLRGGQLVREINRSYYCADAYEYPIVLFRLRSGREVLAHCPDEYCRLEIEDLATGELLTRSASRKPGDFFHSRLITSADGRYLASAGWVWHPIDAVAAYDVEAALVDPTHLDGKGIGIDPWAEESSAAFTNDGRLLVALHGLDDDETLPKLTTTTELLTYDLAHPKNPSRIELDGRLGSLMAVGPRHILAMYEHPRLIDLTTRKVVRSWPHIHSGTQTSSILQGKLADPPPMAIDGRLLRCAFADDTGITVLRLSGIRDAMPS